MDLLDALLSNTTAQSVVALSFSPCFRRHYSGITDAIAVASHMALAAHAPTVRRARERTRVQLISPYLPPPQQRRFWLLAHDATSCPRRFARTLNDRGYVYQPNTLPGNTPVTLGHQYTALVLLTERDTPRASRWVVPLTLRRISTAETETAVAAELLNAVLCGPALPFHEALTVDIVDSKYSIVNFLWPVAAHQNLVTIARSRGTRVYYQPYQADPQAPRKRGAPRRYGTRFALRDAHTWGPPDAVATTRYTTVRGRRYTVAIQAWHTRIMKGKRQRPMWNKPCTLVRIRLLGTDGKPAFKRPLWLIVMGSHRAELTLQEIWEAYRQRYDIEHFFRFGKQHLLLTHYQTPDTAHEETWGHLVQIAYT